MKKGLLFQYIISLICIIGVILLAANQVWKEYWLWAELALGGVSTQAIITDCTGSRYCSITFQYEVTLPGQQIKSYEITQPGPCFDCKKDELRQIRYLPQDPHIARIEGTSQAYFYSCMVVFLLIGAVVYILKIYPNSRNRKTQDRGDERKMC